VFFVVLVLDLGMVCNCIRSFFTDILVFPHQILFSNFDFHGRISHSLSCADFRCTGVQRAAKDLIFLSISYYCLRAGFSFLREPESAGRFSLIPPDFFRVNFRLQLQGLFLLPVTRGFGSFFLLMIF
jgi:hypothetical protein